MNIFSMTMASARRRWDVTALGNGRYEGLRGDRRGPWRLYSQHAELEIPLSAEMFGRKVAVTFDDVMVLQSGGVLVNRATVSKAGLKGEFLPSVRPDPEKAQGRPQQKPISGSLTKLAGTGQWSICAVTSPSSPMWISLIPSRSSRCAAIRGSATHPHRRWRAAYLRVDRAISVVKARRFAGFEHVGEDRPEGVMSDHLVERIRIEPAVTGWR